MQLPLPQKLIESLQHLKGFDEAAFMEVHASGGQITSIRFNPLKLRDNIPLPFGDAPNVRESEAVPWCPHARYLPQRPSFTFDPLFHAGVYYVQEASSMFLWHILEKIVGKNTKGLRILDLCAAPGGKSTLLASYFVDGFIVANETIRSRANILVENISKWGCDNVIVTNNDPADFSKLEGYFDMIVVDAPCSGSGLFRKDNSAVEEWSEENVLLCSRRQQRIVADVYPALKNGGFLVYSTCSYSKEEDEAICDWMMKRYVLSALSCELNPEWNIVESISEKGAYGYRFYPYRSKGEGFFIAAFQKNEGENERHHSSSIPAAPKNEIAAVSKWVKNAGDLFFFMQNENILAIPQQWREDIAFLQRNLYLRKAGVTIGALKGKDVVPHYELALSLLVNEDIPKVLLNKEQAIQYLQKKEPRLLHLPHGWALANYQNINLGWMKVLQNRINNYYPAEWRILKDAPNP